MWQDMGPKVISVLCVTVVTVVTMLQHIIPHYIQIYGIYMQLGECNSFYCYKAGWYIVTLV